MLKNKLNTTLLLFLILFLSCAAPQQEMKQGHPPSFYYLKGLERIGNGEKSLAALQFRRAIELDPSYAPAHEGIARVLAENNQWHEAALHIDRALELDSLWMPAWLLKGRVELHKENYEKAVAVLQKTIARAKKLHAAESKKQLAESALFWTGVARYEQGNWRQAAQIFSVYLQWQPQDTTAGRYLQTATENQKLLTGKSARTRTLAAQKELNRGQLAVLLFENLLPYCAAQRDSLSMRVRDVAPRDTLYGILQKLFAGGLMRPYPDSTFKAHNPAERGALALALGRALEGRAPVSASLREYDFVDVARIYPFYRYVKHLAALGIMRADDGQHFNPHRVLSGIETLRAIEKTVVYLQKAEGNP